MIKKQSDDPDVADAAQKALAIITEILSNLPRAEGFDYGGHELKLGEYDVCTACSGAIAEAQQAHAALLKKAAEIDDSTIGEHLALAAQLFKLEADAATIRAEFHNGHDTEPILDALLGFEYERSIHDEYAHNHAAAAVDTEVTL